MVKYLNKTGSRFIIVTSGVRQMDFYLRQNGVLKRRKADYFSSWGNHGTIAFRLKGKRYELIAQEVIDGLAVVDLCE